MCKICMYKISYMEVRKISQFSDQNIIYHFLILPIISILATYVQL